MHELIQSLYAVLPQPLLFSYKKQPSNFFRSSCSDEDYLLSEKTRLFQWLGRSRLDPHAEIVNLRQLTDYRPDTYHILFKLTHVINYFFTYDINILQKGLYGEAPIERLIVAFLFHSHLFSDSGRQCSGIDEPQKSLKSAAIEFFNNK